MRFPHEAISFSTYIESEIAMYEIFPQKKKKKNISSN